MKIVEDVAKEICSALGESPNAPDRKNAMQPMWLRYEEAAKAAIIVCGSYFAPTSKE